MEDTNHQAIGLRLEEMYHTAVSMHELASKFIANCPRDCDSSFIWAVQELARGQARELEALAEHFQETKLGYYTGHFENEDATIILSGMKQGASA